MEFKLPDIGEGVHEGEIVKWLVKEGDAIEADQPMVEVMTDKATVEIPSPVKGTVSKILVAEGATTLIGNVIVTILEAGKAAAPAPAEQQAPSKPAAPAQPASKPQDRAERVVSQPQNTREDEEVIPFNVLATPATRKLSRDLGVDLKSIKGTGPAGRITKVDVQMSYEGRQAAEPRTSHPSAGVSSVPAISRPKLPAVTRGELQRVPLKGVRKAIAEAMVKSKQTAAHFTYVEEVDMSAIVQLRKNHQAEAEKRVTKLTYLPFIIKALIPTLKEFPYMNSSLDDSTKEIILKGDYNIGVATDTPQGLMVPVIKEADRKNIWELSADIMELAEKARNGKLSLDDIRGGTFTITNAGSLGGVFATPVINHPEVGILGINAIRKRPVVVDDEIVIRSVMYLSLSVDHRVVDGADAARFMNKLVYFLSDPVRFVFA